MFEKPSTWNYKEALCMAELPKLAKEAQELAKIIESVYPEMLGLNENERLRITLDFPTVEYLTRTRVWEAREIKSDPIAQHAIKRPLLYSVECTPEGIFEFFKKRFMFYNGFLEEEPFFKVKAEMFEHFINRVRYYALMKSRGGTAFYTSSVVQTIPVDE